MLNLLEVLLTESLGNERFNYSPPLLKPFNIKTMSRKDAERRARLQGQELAKVELKGKSLSEMAKLIKEAKAKAESRFSAGQDAPVKPTASPKTGAAKQKQNQKMRRLDANAERASRLKTQRDAAEPTSRRGTSTKANVKPAKPSAPTKSTVRTRGTAGTRVSDTAPPSSQRFGPGGMISTVDQPHERRFQWRR